jgi:hypothetical protein
MSFLFASITAEAQPPAVTSARTPPRRLSRLHVREVSLCAAPANRAARIAIAKTSDPFHGASLVQAARRLRAQRLGQRNAQRGVSSTKSLAERQREGRERAAEVLRRGRIRKSDEAAVPIALAVGTAKADEDWRYIAGWASLVEVGGEPVVDAQGHSIGVGELRDADHAFLDGERAGLVEHRGSRAMRVVESTVITPEIAEAMGMQTDRSGWWVAAMVDDLDVWAKVKDGTLTGLSIGGSAVVSGRGGAARGARGAALGRASDAGQQRGQGRGVICAPSTGW